MFLLDWLKNGVSWILLQFHSLLSTFMDPAGGWTWVLSIVGLVIVIRIVLIPLFVKQIKAQRNMQIIQPKIKELQKKYAGDREKQSAEMMKLYRETKTNPLASCLPIILQAPIFFALFSVLQGLAMYQPNNPDHPPPGVFDAETASQGHSASIFGAPLYGYFMGAYNTELINDGFSPMSTRIVSAILIVLMTATSFLTQRQMILKNSAPGNPMVRQQKILMYVFPLVFAVGGINFPIGVLIYWFTTNVWTMGQQFYVIRNNPQPDTPAAEAHEKRKALKASRKALKNGSASAAVVEGEVVEPTPDVPAPRVQPKKQSRSKRKSK